MENEPLQSTGLKISIVHCVNMSQHIFTMFQKAKAHHASSSSSTSCVFYRGLITILFCLILYPCVHCQSVSQITFLITCRYIIKMSIRVSLLQSSSSAFFLTVCVSVQKRSSWVFCLPCDGCHCARLLHDHQTPHGLQHHEGQNCYE